MSVTTKSPKSPVDSITFTDEIIFGKDFAKSKSVKRLDCALSKLFMLGFVHVDGYINKTMIVQVVEKAGDVDVLEYKRLLWLFVYYIWHNNQNDEYVKKQLTLHGKAKASRFVHALQDWVRTRSNSRGGSPNDIDVPIFGITNSHPSSIPNLNKTAKKAWTSPASSTSEKSTTKTLAATKTTNAKDIDIHIYDLVGFIEFLFESIHDIKLPYFEKFALKLENDVTLRTPEQCMSKLLADGVLGIDGTIAFDVLKDVAPSRELQDVYKILLWKYFYYVWSFNRNVFKSNASTRAALIGIQRILDGDDRYAQTREVSILTWNYILNLMTLINQLVTTDTSLVIPYLGKIYVRLIDNLRAMLPTAPPEGRTAIEFLQRLENGKYAPRYVQNNNSDTADMYVGIVLPSKEN